MGQRENDMARALQDEALLQKFRTNARGEVKLACALRGYALGEHREVYLPYLRSRMRPAVTELIRAGRVSELAVLEPEGFFPEERIDEYLSVAIASGVQESIVWLLRLKERRLGFPRQEYRL